MSSQYIDWWALAAWCGINIVIPVVAPLLVLWLFSKPSTTSIMAGHNVLKSIGKGELFWAAMAMSAATCYELYSLQKILLDPDAQGLVWAAFWIHQFVILFSVIFVGVGSLNASPASAANPHVPDPTVFRASIVTLIFTVVTYMVSHTVLMEREARLRAEAQSATKRERQAIIDGIRNCLGQDRGNEIRCMEGLK